MKINKYTVAKGFPREAGNKMLLKAIDKWVDTAKVGDKFIITYGDVV